MRTQRLTVALAAVLTAGIFGPYTSLMAGVRYEHLAVYGAVVAIFPFTWLRLRLSPPIAAVIWLWSLVVVVSTIGLVAPPVNTTGYGEGRLIAELDKFCLPLAAMVLSLVLMANADRYLLLRVVAAVTMAAMSVNSILALISVWTDITWLLHWFWTNEVSAADAVMSPPETMGRFSGIFVMPAQAGAAYGIALLAAIWLLRDHTAWLVSVVSLIVLGGILSVSKIFLLVALPLAIFNLVRTSGRVRRVAAVVLGALATTALVGGGLFSTWQGKEGLRYLMAPSGDPLRFYSAGRLGDGSDFDTLMGAVTSVSPVYGMGARGLKVAVDGSLVEVITIAGVLGVALLIGVILVLLRTCWSHRDPTPDSHFEQGLTLLAIGASFGIPVFTTGRVASVLWLLLCLSVLSRPLVRVDLPSDGRLMRVKLPMRQAC